MSKRKAEKQTSLRFTPEALILLRMAAQSLGVTQASILEMAVREFAKSHGIVVEVKQDKDKDGISSESDTL